MVGEESGVCIYYQREYVFKVWLMFQRSKIQKDLSSNNLNDPKKTHPDPTLKNRCNFSNAFIRYKLDKWVICLDMFSYLSNLLTQLICTVGFV